MLEIGRYLLFEDFLPILDACYTNLFQQKLRKSHLTFGRIEKIEAHSKISVPIKNMYLS